VAQFAVGGTSMLAIVVLCLRAESLYRAAISAVVFGIIWTVSVYDARTLLAPNKLVYPGLLFALGAAFTLGRGAGLEALNGAFLAFGVMLVIALIGRGQMGMGDVKMAALCGAAVGIRAVLPMLAITFLLGGVIAAAALLSRRRSRSESMAFTPFLGIAVLIATSVWHSYLL
jgi:leader peptidase (prepilin peptidase)/N-methyltransferase